MPVANVRTFDALATPGAGYPKYRLTKADGTLVQDWTNSGVSALTNSLGAATSSYSVTLSLDPAAWYRIAWDPGDGTVTTEVFHGSTYAGEAVAAVTDKAGFKLAADGMDAITVETGVNARQAQSLILAAAAGEISGAATGTVLIDAAGATAMTRIMATTDDDGNRMVVTLTPPA